MSTGAVPSPPATSALPVALGSLYRPSLGLLTDLYQLTMAAGYWKLGLAERPAIFHLFARRPPFGGGWAVAAGLGPALELLEGWGFDRADLDYLATLTGNDGGALFEEGFLRYLEGLSFTCDVDAVPEGSLVAPPAPLLRVRGPLLQAQILETPLLTLLNFQTLVATKSARIALAAGDDPVLEFGLRRAQGIDGGLSASRAAYLGGATGTSNVLAGRLYGIPVKGTHAHSWVMVFDDEPAAFAAYASALPNNCVFLVDTYDTVEGVHRAVAAGRELRARGHELVGVRLDSGDLGALAEEARRILDEGGFPDAAVVASNDLDEYRIAELKACGAPIAVWGVGTRLVTAHDQPSLGGVYKLGAIQDDEGRWQPRVKLSENPVKVSIPGCLQVRRRVDPETGFFAGDELWDEHGEAPAPCEGDDHDLLVPCLRGGRRVLEPVPLAVSRARARAGVLRMPPEQRALRPDAPYPLTLTPSLADQRAALMRRTSPEESA